MTINDEIFDKSIEIQISTAKAKALASCLTEEDNTSLKSETLASFINIILDEIQSLSEDIELASHKIKN